MAQFFDTSKTVLVVDASGKVLDDTRPGKARKLIRDGKAMLVDKDVPILQLKNEVPVDKIKEGSNMIGLRKLGQFLAENEQVYVRNMRPKMVWALTFRNQYGDVQPFSIPYTDYPFCITDWVTKDMLMNSGDFKRIVQRIPLVIDVMGEQEYEKQVQGVAIQDLEIVQRTISDAQRGLTYVDEAKPTATVTAADAKPEDIAQTVLVGAEKGDVVAGVQKVANERRTDVVSTSVTPVMNAPQPDVGVVGINPRIVAMVDLLNNDVKANIKSMQQELNYGLKSKIWSYKDLDYFAGKCTNKSLARWAAVNREKILSEAAGVM